MNKHWFVVANQEKLRIFTEVDERNRLKQVATLENPLGRERNRALVRKQAGRGVKTSGRTGSSSYSMKKNQDPHADAAMQFARDISKFMERERLKNNFLTLSIVAEPNFLGKIRTKLKPGTKKCVVNWIKKDLQRTPKLELQRMLVPESKSEGLQRTI